MVNPICKASINLGGEHYPCTFIENNMLPGTTGHDGWAHSNAEASAIWTCGEEG